MPKEMYTGLYGKAWTILWFYKIIDGETHGLTTPNASPIETHV